MFLVETSTVNDTDSKFEDLSNYNDHFKVPLLYILMKTVGERERERTKDKVFAET